MTSWPAIGVIFGALVTLSQSNPQPPHIIFIMADDLGWNDVGFHGSNQIPTPNIDALAYDGVILNNYYVAPICTPSRSALMTGKYPIHTGLQHGVLKGAEPRGLPLNETLLPQYLRRLGYKTHIVGKWHLGLYTKEHTPTARGFDSHLGYWTGHQDYFDHSAVELPYWGLDMRRDMEPAWDLHGQYSTDVFTDEAVRLVHAHNGTAPMFLYVAHAAVHSGNPYNPLPVHDRDVLRVKNIEDYNRRKYSAIVQKLDKSVGLVVRALSEANMLDNSVIVFTTDNGGPAEGFNLNAASNWPLRGVKDTLWEGGVRGAGLIWSKLIKAPRRVASQLFHISDWLPTLYTAAGGNSSDLGEMDGLDAWEALSEDAPSSRSEVLHNIDDIYGNAAITVGDWKLIKGSRYKGKWDGWYGPSGRDDNGRYDVELVQQSISAKRLELLREPPSPETIAKLRETANVQCYGSAEAVSGFEVEGSGNGELERSGNGEPERTKREESQKATRGDPEGSGSGELEGSSGRKLEGASREELLKATNGEPKWFTSSDLKASRDEAKKATSQETKWVTSGELNATSDELNATSDELKGTTIGIPEETTGGPGCNLAVEVCLFNIKEDPCELYNVASKYPEKLEELERLLEVYNATALPPNNVPPEERGNPRNWGNVWNNFGDYPTVELV